MPENSGAIVWSRSIIKRVKTPIEQFKTKEGMLTQWKTGKAVAKKYVQLAKKLADDYETYKYTVWKNQKTTDAMSYLHQYILSAGTTTKYKVNFNPKLRIIIREAKFLDRIGLYIPHTITSIALQDKEYMGHVDKLNQLLRSYNLVTGDLRMIESRLLQKEIRRLDAKMEKGMHNHNWFSLSISTFIKDCQSAIDSFREIKGRVL
jgi:dynein heavy chain